MTTHSIYLTDSCIHPILIPHFFFDTFLTSPFQVEGNQRDDSGASAILVAAEVGRHQVIPSLLRPLGENSGPTTGLRFQDAHWTMGHSYGCFQK